VRFEPLCLVIALAVSSVGVFKKESYISPIWGDAPNNLTVTKFCNFNQLYQVYLYSPSRVLGAGPQNLHFPIDLRGDLYNIKSSTKLRCDNWFDRPVIQKFV